jgi:hypothetical protein
LAELGARDVCVNSSVHGSIFPNALINALIDALIVCSSLTHYPAPFVALAGPAPFSPLFAASLL